MKPPAFQFYADDFLAGVADMTQAEVGAYILLLCAQWSRGAIPTDPERAALIAKGDVSAHVMAKFPDGMNPRMEQVRQKQADYRAKQADNGRKGMAKRWHNGAYNEPITSLQPKHNSPSPSPSPSPSSSEDKGCAVDDRTLRLKAEKKYSQEAKVVLSYLNAKTGRSYRESDNSLAPIQARLNEPDVTVGGIQTMIDRQVANWRNGPMEEYLRPSTLFAPTKFNEYYAAKDCPPQTHERRIAEKRVDRSIGTANEGIASQYEGLGKMA